MKEAIELSREKEKGMRQKALFDNEAKKWESLYRAGGGERWGIFQKNVRARTVARMELCLSLLPPVKGRNVIELGCGPGFYGARLIAAGARWTGLDLSGPMLAVCRGNIPGARVARGNVLALPFRPASCDVMLCVGVLSYLSRAQIGSLFSQAYSALRGGGFFLTQTVLFDPFTWVRCRLPASIPRPIRIPGPFTPRSPRTIRRLLEKNGFAVRRVVTYWKYLAYPAGDIYLAEKV
jgi:SAM-dependent methyltransferase